MMVATSRQYGGLEIELSPADLRRVEHALRESPRAVGRILKNAANRTATWMRKELVTMLVAELGTRGRRVNRQLTSKRATTRYPVATLTIKRDKIPLMNLAARQTKRGVSYTLARTRRKVPHAFIATIGGTGHKGVFLRAEMLKGHARPQRRPRKRSSTSHYPDLPIQELFGPSLVTLLRRNPRLMDRIRTMAADQFRREVGVDLEKEMTKLAGKRRAT